MDILISGVGGQGTILASKILAYSAAIEGKNSRTGETIGMSQRGGCVVSHVRTGSSYSPYIPVGGADLILSFELCEGARSIPYLKKGGYAIINNTSITPVSTALGMSKYNDEKMTEYIASNCKSVFIDGDNLAKQCGNVRAVNSVLIGVAFGLGVLDVSRESIIQSMEKNIKPRYLELNIKSFDLGIKAVEEMK